MSSLDDTCSSVSEEERNRGESFDVKKDDHKKATDGELNGEVVGSTDEINVSLDVENERDTMVNDNSGERFGDDEYMNLNRNENGIGKEGEHGSDEDSDMYQIGDFVWGKIKSHPWWPGQIYDSIDASETAIKHRRDGCHLVAFFGDGSWAWCPPSQLIPFTENFNEKLMNSSSKIFLKAVQAAVDEIVRILESKMTCNCVSIDKRENLSRRVVSNSGVKPRVPIPYVDIKRLSVPDYAAADVLAKVNNLATTLSTDNLVELAALRGWLTAMFHSKGERQPPEYHDYDVEGLEDMNGTIVEVTNDFSVPIEVPILGPTDEDWDSPPAVNDAMTQEAMTDKIYHRRKQKSVADLMREDNGVKAIRRKKTSGRESKDSKRSSSSVEQKCGVGDTKEGLNERGSSRGKNGSKRKFKVSESSDVISGDSSKAGNVDLRIEIGAKNGGLAGKPNGISIASVENDYGKVIEDSDNASTHRERKKSKYLSPPYISPRWRIGSSSFKLESESGQTPKKDEESKEDQDLKASETLSASHQDVANSSSNEKQLGNDSQSSEVDADKRSFSTSDVVTPVNEVLSGIQTAAIDPLYLSREGTLDVVSAFTSAFRSSTYVHGGKNEVYQKQVNNRKRKSSLLKLGKEEEKLTAGRPKLASVRSPKTRKPVASSSTHEQVAETYRGQIEGHTYLVLAFTPQLPLPSKEEIMKMFSKYGSLNVEETKVISDSHLVQVVYTKESNAQTALNYSANERPFGENVSCWLQPCPASSKLCSNKATSSTQTAPDKLNDDIMLDVQLIRQKFEIMGAILENYHLKFSIAEKHSLKDEIKSLMESVEAASDKVRVLAEKHRQVDTST